MESIYVYLLIVHICCAIIFLGYIFTDVMLLTPLRKYIDKEILDKVFAKISQRGVKIMPPVFLLLILSGGALISRYIGGESGYFESPLQILLIIKMCVALLIAIMVIISLSCKFLNLKNPLANIIHPVALVLGFIVVILAKLAFYVVI